MIFKNVKKNTYPLVLHFNGKTRYNKMTDYLIDEVIYPLKLESPKELTIITFATKDIIDICPLLKQLDLNNIKYVNLCDVYEFEKWDNTLKIKFLYRYLKENNVKTEYVTVLDAIDVLLSENFKNIITKFKNTDKKILYGSTINKYPEVNIETDMDMIIREYSPFCYLNAGTVIAETPYLLDFIEMVYNNLDEKNNHWKSEQYEIRKIHNIYDKNIIGYDYKCEIFQTGSGIFSIVHQNVLDKKNYF